MSEFSPITGIDPKAYTNGYGSVSYGDDSGLFVEFFRGPYKLGKRSEEMGRDIYEERDFIRIIIPGGKSEIVRQVTEGDKKRFWQRWEPYSKGLEAPLQGTPIETWPILNTAQVAEFKYKKIFSVEQIAALPDVTVQEFPYGFETRAKARAFIASATENAPIMKLASENEELKKELGLLRDEVGKIAAQRSGINESIKAIKEESKKG